MRARARSPKRLQLLFGLFFGLIFGWELFSVSLAYGKRLSFSVGDEVVVDQLGMDLTQSSPHIRWSTDYSSVVGVVGTIESLDVSLHMYEIRYKKYIAWFPAEAVLKTHKKQLAKLQQDITNKLKKRSNKHHKQHVDDDVEHEMDDMQVRKKEHKMKLKKRKQLNDIEHDDSIDEEHKPTPVAVALSDLRNLLDDDDEGNARVRIVVGTTPLRVISENEDDQPTPPDALTNCFTASKNGNTITFQTRFKTYLAIGSDGKIAIDRVEARSFENFYITPAGKKNTFTLHIECPASICGKTIRRYISETDGLISGRDSSSGAAKISFFKCIDTELDAKNSFSSPKVLKIPKITIFATLKPISKWDKDGYDEQFFDNSMSIWQKLSVSKRYVLSEDKKTRALAESKDDIKSDGEITIISKYHVPTYRSIFQRVIELESSGFFVFTNIDLLFTSSLTKTIAAVSDWVRHGTDISKILLVGRRFNHVFGSHNRLKLSESDDWEEKVENLKGKQWQEDAVDYFIVTSDAFDFSEDGDIPPMVVGGTAFDNWLLQKALLTPDITVIDTTSTVTAIHQTPPQESLFSSHQNPQSAYNHKLGEAAGGWAKGKVTQAPYATFWYHNNIVIHKRGIVT